MFNNQKRENDGKVDCAGTLECKWMFRFDESLFQNDQNRCPWPWSHFCRMWWRLFDKLRVTLTSQLFISSGFAKKCDIEVLAAYCNANSSCQGFNTNGLLKSCTSGCQAQCCYDFSENVDLYIRKGFLPPDDWQEEVETGKILFANPEPHFCFLPEIANGYIGTVAMSASLFQSGLFNGKVKGNGVLVLFLLIGSSVEVLERRDYRHR